MNIPYMHIFMAASSIQHPASSIQHPASSIQHPASSIQHPAFAKTAAYKGSRGFTLVELSIVIVIIGLIVAGVVAGQSLIRQAQWRALLSGAQKYTAAVNTFKMAYNGLPGDMTNAQSYWSSTVNGNGNRYVERVNASFINTENQNAWEQLSLAGLIEGSFTGNGPVVRGGNVPKAPIGKGVYTFAGGSVAGRPPTNYLAFDEQQLINSFPDRLGGGAISGLDASKLDIKYDDGIPHTGQILCVSELDQGSTPSSAPIGCPTGAYTISQTDKDSILLWPF